ncbi:MAG: hypothetical protein H7A23_26050 [Leptospiraceae bacterium]|nr:hypothetical protein [Leptospiraceae bacterium]MCP5498033.1 hypothetical protein [Leptospiraceae bacterium]
MKRWFDLVFTGWKPVVLLLLLLSCEINKKANYEDEYKQALLLTYLLKSSTTALQSCIDANTSGYSCVESASGIKDNNVYQPFSEYYYTAVVTYPAYLLTDTYYVVSLYSSISDYCSAYVKSDAFTNLSDRTIACISDCQKDFWDARKSNNLCGESAYSQIVGSYSSGISSCRINCLKPTGNEL